MASPIDAIMKKLDLKFHQTSAWKVYISRVINYQFSAKRRSKFFSSQRWSQCLPAQKPWTLLQCGSFATVKALDSVLYPFKHLDLARFWVQACRSAQTVWKCSLTGWTLSPRLLPQIPRYILTLHELLAHTPHEHVERNSLDYAKSKLEELSRYAIRSLWKCKRTARLKTGRRQKKTGSPAFQDVTVS